MPITKYLEKNAELYANDCALVELNPEVRDTRRITWKEFDLTQPEPNLPYRREISWRIFNEKANRCAHYLLERGVRRGDKVGILMMNCLEWLPIYFGILKTGALAVPLNFRYASDEIEYCLNLADIDVLFFGPEFIGRIPIVAKLEKLTSQDLQDILTKPKNSIISQFKEMLKIDGICFETSQGAIKLIAEQAVDLGDGARGLRTILENNLLDAMYSLPKTDVKKFTLDVEEKTLLLKYGDVKYDKNISGANA